MNRGGGRLFQRWIGDEGGLIVSAELVIVATVIVLGLIVGLAQVQQAVVSELQDTALAFTGLNQSYGHNGFVGCWKFGRGTSWTAGSFFVDVFDTCVGTGGITGGTSDIIGGGPAVAPAAPTVVTPVPERTPTPCGDCVPATPAVPDPCLSCPPGVAPQPAVPQGPAPQNLPQE